MHFPFTAIREGAARRPTSIYDVLLQWHKVLLK